MNDSASTLTIRENLIARIREKGRWRGKVKTLMGVFRYTTSHRVHAASWQTVKETLSDWGISLRLSNGETAHDWVTLTRPERLSDDLETCDLPAITQTGEAEEISTLNAFSPISFLFHCGESREENASLRIASDILDAVWSWHPLCLLVEAPEESFSFLCGFFSAILRRRANISRNYDGSTTRCVEVVGKEHLRRMLGSTSDPSPLTGPVQGAVYIVRDTPEYIELSDLVAELRKTILPHTYYLKADTNSSSTPDRGSGWGNMQRWFASFAGSLDVRSPAMEGAIDIGSLLAETVQLHDSLFGRQSRALKDPCFKAGLSENTKHMVLKSVIIDGLRDRYPSAQPIVEGLVHRDDQSSYGEPTDVPRSDRPDVHIDSRVWVEIETLRGIAFRGSDPFLTLETKLRQKLPGMKKADEIWLVMPSDLVALAAPQVSAIANNLNEVLGKNKVRAGFVDMLSKKPVFLESLEPEGRREPRLTGIIPGRGKPISVLPPRSWDLIAGYGDLKESIEGDLLHPLFEPEKYRGLAANSLLLYGLPGCGKSLIGRMIAEKAQLPHQIVTPSDLTSMWLGEGVSKIRQLFDWALKHAPCLLIIDELDAVAPRRQEVNMHSDEKRQVSELLTQFDRIADKRVVVVATTNYLQGIDMAIQRSGRFDLKVPVFPPTKHSVISNCA